MIAEDRAAEDRADHGRGESGNDFGLVAFAEDSEGQRHDQSHGPPRGSGGEGGDRGGGEDGESAASTVEQR